MALIKSISGIRGTIGGKSGNGLTPLDIVKFASAYAKWLKTQSAKQMYKVIIGRDARISGAMVKDLVIQTLTGAGIHIVDLDLATTPTVEVAVTMEKADGGIIITASHNPRQWNALKLLNNAGEFLSADDGKKILEFVSKESFEYATIDKLGTITKDQRYLDRHVLSILNLPLVDIAAIKKANFTVLVDGINSVGGIAVPHLLWHLGIENIIKINCRPTGEFAHNPEPIPENLTEISQAVLKHNADMAFVVDPDVDRLAIINEDGTPFGEEYTLVAVADYVLSHKKGNTVSNLSSTQALRDITEKHGGKYFSSAVGEVNVVEVMKRGNAIIGGEGNGGVIYPKAHYGRDALVGIALFLSHLAQAKTTCSELRKTYPNYYIAKSKLSLKPGDNVDNILKTIEEEYKSKNVQIDTTDGVKLWFTNEWIHLRKSNTEPIIRIYAESTSESKAKQLGQKIVDKINTIL